MILNLPAVPLHIVIAMIYLLTVFLQRSPCLLTTRGAEVEHGPCGRRGCGVSDSRSGCHRDQPAKEQQCLASVKETLDVLQPPVETAAALVGNPRVGKHSYFMRGKSQCLLSSYQLKKLSQNIQLVHIEIQSNSERYGDVRGE